MKPYFFIVSLIFNFLILSSASATSLLPISLEQLSTRASLIFHGEVVTNQVKKDGQSGRIATFTEFKIIDLIKGKTADTHTIKQIGGHLKSANTTLRIHGVPEYIPGNRYVVFLPEKSRLGFSSPLGLHQGSFSVTSIDGEQIVSNGRNPGTQPPQGRRNVQIPLAVRADKPSQSRLDDFMNTVRAYNSP